MKLHLESPGTTNRISAYDESSVTVAGTRIEQSFLVTPEDLHTGVQIPEIDQLRWTHLELLHDSDIGILIVGTGRRQRLPDPRLYAELAARGVGLEAMDSAAACRTYNILLGEGRRVAALIIVS